MRGAGAPKVRPYNALHDSGMHCRQPLKLPAFFSLPEGDLLRDPTYLESGVMESGVRSCTDTCPSARQVARGSGG